MCCPLANADFPLGVLEYAQSDSGLCLEGYLPQIFFQNSPPRFRVVGPFSSLFTSKTNKLIDFWGISRPGKKAWPPNNQRPLVGI